MKSHHRGLRIAICAALLAVGLSQAACIAFQEQTLTYQYDARTDRLYVYSVFTGVFGDDDSPHGMPQQPPGLSPLEESQLAAAARGEQAFFFDNWLLGFDVGAAKDQVDSRAEPTERLPDTPSARRLRDAQRLLAASTTISNGPFFLDDRGRLSAAQRVTLRGFTPLLATFNDAMRLKAIADLEEGRDMSDDDFAMTSAAAGGLPLLSIEGNRIVLRWGAIDEESGRAGNDALVAAGATFAFSRGIASLTFGQVRSLRESLTVRCADNYRPNAIAFVRAQFGLADRFDPRADATRFFPATRR